MCVDVLSMEEAAWRGANLCKRVIEEANETLSRETRVASPKKKWRNIGGSLTCPM